MGRQVKTKFSKLFWSNSESFIQCNLQWFVNKSQCQSSCRKISLKLFQRDKSLLDSFKGQASKFCIYFSFKSCHPFVLLPLWERRREGGAADKNFCLPSDQPTILFFGNGNCSKSVCKEILAYESFSDVGEIRVYFASKILTPCRMHWNAFLIAQIIAKCHSFPNM